MQETTPSNIDGIGKQPQVKRHNNWLTTVIPGGGLSAIPYCLIYIKHRNLSDDWSFSLEPLGAIGICPLSYENRQYLVAAAFCSKDDQFVYKTAHGLIRHRLRMASATSTSHAPHVARYTLDQLQTTPTNFTEVLPALGFRLEQYWEARVSYYSNQITRMTAYLAMLPFPTSEENDEAIEKALAGDEHWDVPAPTLGTRNTMRAFNASWLSDVPPSQPQESSGSGKRLSAEEAAQKIAQRFGKFLSVLAD
jgi:hypothetical protein